jgi:hypothetical protein
LEPWHGKADNILLMPELEEDKEWEVKEIQGKEIWNYNIYYLL